MRILVIADEESYFARLGNCRADIVIACGDLGSSSVLRTAQAVSAAQVFAVKGNHDDAGSFPDPIVNLHLNTVQVGGLTFGGFQGAWRYKPRGHFLYEQEEVVELIEVFPAVDVFVSHNSPRGVHDRDDDVHFGFEAYLSYIERAKPRLFLHGHQHVNRRSTVGQTTVLGVYGHHLLEIT